MAEGVRGLTVETFSNMQLDAGVLLHSIDLDSITEIGDMRTLIKESLSGDRSNFLGASRGGHTFTMNPETRSIEVDGKRSEWVGSTVLDSNEISLESTLVEFDPKILQTIIPTAEIEEKGNGITVLKARTYLKNEDYLQNVVWVGDWGSRGMIAIELQQVLNVSGLTVTIQDKGEGEYTATFTPHQADFEEADYLPFRWYFLESDIEEEEMGI